VEPKALEKVNTTTAVQKAASEAELLAAGQKFFCESLGVSDPEVATVLVNQVKQLQAVMSLGDGVGGLSIALGMMFEMKPENLAQGLLAVQMSGVHLAALLHLKRAGLVAQGNLNSKTPEANMLTAMRLMSLFNEQLEAMAKLKGKTRQQKVIVEHVHVHHGGQAIVGTVTAAGRTGGAKQEGVAMKRRITPQAKRRGWLKNGNPTGDFSKAPRCGAKTRRGSPCRCPAMKNGRCRLHGGLSTGPKTAEGIERIRRAVTKHGRYTAAAKAERRRFRQFVKHARKTIRELAAAQHEVFQRLAQHETKRHSSR
jgi:hypothetical protein